MTPFSVVMSVYHADNPDFFLQAVDSVLSQTIPPRELIVSVDGPVTPGIEAALSEIEKLPVTRLLRLPENQGPGGARHTAILSARHEIVAIMDADDISLPDRFEQQLGHLESSGADVVGGFIEEFEKVPGDLRRIRRVPLTHGDISRFGKWRQPMNHVTIMFRREAYMRAGGYQALRSIEDYDLYYRLCMTGAKFANIRNVLVFVRGGTSILNRRRGLLYLRRELALIRRMRQSGFLTAWQWVANSSVRIAIRSLPSPLVSLIYWLLRK
ncbi:MAG: glycosyltransferase [Pseudomonadota bacterium]